MAEKERLIKVQFWVGENLKRELDGFAHGLKLSTSDLYKAGALMLKNMILQPPEITVNMFTRSFKDFENKQMQEKILKSYKQSKSVY